MTPAEEKIDHLPTDPGVYLFKDPKGTILYVGKAGNIRHRVNSYFQRAREKDAKTLAMMEKVADIETIVTNTEKEALILEDHLVKEHHPRYNVKLRDDKRYPCLRLSIEEEFPTLSIVRRIKKDRSLYFGPYPSATSLKETLKLIRRLFPIRTCLDTKFSNRLRPCINYEMGRCAGPCCGKIDPVQHGEMIRQVRMFLEGRNQDLLENLKKEMEEESRQLHFERAARIRDQIGHIERVIEKQKIVSRDFLDQDVIGLHRRDRMAILYCLFIRAGKLSGGRGFALSSMELPDEELLASFLQQYYREDQFIPDQILIPRPFPEQGLAEEELAERKGRRIRIIIPRRGEKKELLDMACENAEKFLPGEKELEKERHLFLKTLKEKLHLNRAPKKIEAFDISNLQGGSAVGSMVAFEDGEPAREGYRHFKIKTVEGADDYGMMYEVLLRRYQRAVEEKDFPDLVLLDGGKGQLNIAKEVFKELRIEGVDLISLAKGRRTGGDLSHAGKTGEKIFHPQYRNPIILGRQSPVLLFLDRIRDEAHRFAIAYHKKVRRRETIRSALEAIPGIGRARQRELLRFFESVEKIRGAPLEELAKVPKMDLKSSQRVYEFFHSSPK